jgi:hypothetical protein
VTRPLDSQSFLSSVVTVVDVASGVGHRLVQTHGRSLAWSPDARRIAFARCTGGGLSSNCQLRSVDVDTRRTRPIRPIYPAGWDWH